MPARGTAARGRRSESSPPERATSSTASRKRSQPRTSSTEVKRPAIDCDAAVLDRRRRAHDEREPTGVGQCPPGVVQRLGSMPGRERRSSLDPVPAVVTDEARQDRDAGGPGPGERGRLGADEIGTPSELGVQVDHRRGSGRPGRPRAGSDASGGSSVHRPHDLDAARVRALAQDWCGSSVTPARAVRRHRSSFRPGGGCNGMNVRAVRNSSLRRRALRHTPW